MKPVFRIALATSALLLNFSVEAGVILQEGFESGVLPPGFTALHSNDGRATVTTNFAPVTGNWHLVLDDSSNDAVYSASTVTFEIDISNKQNIFLEFYAKSLGNEPHYSYSPSDFTGLPQFDGVSVSKDGGVTWRQVHWLGSLGETWELQSVYLDYSLDYWDWNWRPESKVLIRISEYDNASAPIDGIAIDDVVVRAEDWQQVLLEMPQTVLEGSAHIAYVMLAVPQTNAVTVQLSALPEDQVGLPASVQIPAGETFVSFSFNVADDTLVNLARDVEITASLPGAATSHIIQILDNETPVATLSLPAQMAEGTVTNGLITLDRAALYPMTVSFSSSPYGLSVPNVTIPAGQTNVLFEIQVGEDNMVSGTVLVTLFAYYPGMITAQAETRVKDNDAANLVLVFPENIVEGRFEAVRIDLGASLPTNLVVTLSTTNTGLVIPSPVTVNAGVTSLQFQVNAPDNALKNPRRFVYVTASAPGFTNSTAACTILDNDVGGYVIRGLADIVDVTRPATLNVAATSLSGEAIPNSNGYAAMEVVLANGSAIPISPAQIPLSGESGWNGEVQFPVEIVGPARLRVRDASGNEGLSHPFDIMRSQEQHFAGVVWDHIRGRFYATIGSGGTGGYSNQVVVIDPVTAQVTHRLPLAQDPGQLSLTSGGEFLYVVLNANGTIARIDPGSMTVQSVFPVGASSSGTLYANDICTVAGQPNLVVVAQKRDVYWDAYYGVAVYENGIARAQTVVSTLGGFRIEPSSEPNVFYAESSSGLRKLLVGPSGVTEAEANGTLLNEYDADIRSDGDYVLSSSGILVDGKEFVKLGVFPVNSFGCPYLAANRVIFLNWSTLWSGNDMLQAYDPLTFEFFLELSLSREVGVPRTFMRWGTNGLAFLTDSELVLINSSRLVPSGAPADLDVGIGATPTPAMVGVPLAYSVSLTNKGPNAASAGFIQAVLSEGQSVQTLHSTQGTPMLTNSVVRLDYGSIIAGGSIELSITALPESAGTLSCSVVAGSESVDPQPSNNLAKVSLSAGAETELNEVNLVRLNANNLVQDAIRGLIWVTTRPASGSSSGHVLSIDTQTGIMSQPLSISGDPVPGCMALSANGRYLYAGVRSPSMVVRIDLAANEPAVTNIYLGADFGDPMDIEPLAGDGTGFVAVSSSRYEAFVFDGDARRPIGSGSSSVTQIEKTGAPDTFVGFLSWGSYLRQMVVTSSGIVVTQQTSQILSGSPGIRGAGDLILSSSGKLVDARTLTLKASFDVSGSPCLDDVNHLAFIVNGNRLYSFHTSTLFPDGSFDLPEALGTDTPQSCIRWGVDGFAVNTESGSIYLGRWSAIPAAPDSNVDGMADDWELLYFQTLNVDPLADPDQDGLYNCMEFLYGSSPVQPSVNPMQVSLVNSGGEDKLRLLFPRRSGLSPQPYGYESSADLSNWSAAVNLTETTVGTDEIEGVPVEWVEVLLPATNGTGFLRFTWGLSPSQ